MYRSLLFALGVLLVISTTAQFTLPLANAGNSSAVLDEAAQSALSPADVLSDLKAGNQRFVQGKLTKRDWNSQVEATAKGQYPKAVILGCVDSRVPPEIVFDQGIGDVFVGRVAGNFENPDQLGSLEFATAVAGSPLIVVLGHTSCGAIKGAVDGVELGNLTAMLETFGGSIEAAREYIKGELSSSNEELITAVVEENIRQTVKDIQTRSEVISGLIESGDLAVVGAMYDLSTGEVSWLD